MRREVTLVAAAVASCAASGCYSTWDIEPKSLRVLDGFHGDEARPLPTKSGEVIPFTSDTELYLRGKDRLSVSAKFSVIYVRGSRFGGVEGESGAIINADLARMESVRAERFSVGKTTALCVGIGVGVSAIVTVMAIAAGGLGAGE